MSDFLKTIQSDVVQAARESFGADWSTAALQPALIEMRKSYAAITGPDFSRSEIRLAYALASHPYHAFMAYELFSQCVHVLKSQTPGKFSAVILGAGPGAEAIALIRVLAEKVPDLNHISLTLIDKESGWTKTRRVTLEQTAQHWWQGQLTLNEVTADLSTDEGRQTAINSLVDVDLVVAQAVLTEIVEGNESVNLLADLVNNFSADSLLLLCDFTKMKGLHNWINELDAIDSIRTVLALQHRFPMPSCHEDVKPLFVSEDYLRERGQVTVTARLYSRPGWHPPVINVSDEFIPTEGQKSALDSFATFVRSDSANTFLLEGPAGTGKTEIMRRMASIATAEGMSVSLWAPTGQAAVRLSARTNLPAGTIHSALFERSGRTDNDAEDFEWPPTIIFTRRQLDYSQHVVFIDEASMIGDRVAMHDDQPPELIFEDGRLLTHILDGVIKNNGKVVFVGDSCQLPPIDEEYPVALDRRYLESRGCEVVESKLTAVTRVKDDSEILNFSMNLRGRVLAGEHGIAALEFRVDSDVVPVSTFDLPFLIDQFKKGDAVALAGRNVDVANANMLIRGSLGRLGELPESDDRLVLTKGNDSLGLMNGTEISAQTLIGDVVEVSLRNRRTKELEVVRLQKALLTMKLPSGDVLEFTATIVVDTLGAASSDLLSIIRRVLWVDFQIRMRAAGIDKKQESFWQIYEGDERANALVSCYSYARTLHRAQGGEWKSVVVDVQSILPVRPGTSRYAYSAITRAKEALYLRGWPRVEREPRTHEQLAEAPMSLLQIALNRRFTFQALPPKTTTVQLSPEDNSSGLRVNLYDGAKGITFNSQNGTPDETNAVARALGVWSKLESVRGRHEVPVRLEARMARLQSMLEQSNIDLFVVRPGNATREVEIYAFLNKDFAIFRSTWTDQSGLNLQNFRSVDTNSSSLRDLVSSLVTRVFSD